MIIKVENHIKIAEAIVSLVPNAMFGIIDDTISWSADNTVKKPSNAKIMAEVDRLATVAESTSYISLRAQAYPSVTEQLDMQYWDSVHGTTTFRDAIDAIKAQFPKPI